MNPRGAVQLLIAVASAVVLAACGGGMSGSPNPASGAVDDGVGGFSPAQALAGPYAVTRVVDGDTIHVRVGPRDVKVRLIGIDTPETVAPGRPVECFGPEASARAHQLMDGRSVYLEYDDSQGRTDKYGRTLAYVWLSPSESVNADLLAGGFAQEYTYEVAYSHQAVFQSAEAGAVSSGAGLWSACQ